MIQPCRLKPSRATGTRTPVHLSAVSHWMIQQFLALNPDVLMNCESPKSASLTRTLSACRYLAHGTATDYMYDVLKIPLSFTWEIYGDEQAGKACLNPEAPKCRQACLLRLCHPGAGPELKYLPKPRPQTLYHSLHVGFPRCSHDAHGGQCSI